jgi:hypothetical protein
MHFVRLKPGASETQDFELSRVANISGHLIDRDSGNPIAGFSVHAIRRASPPGNEAELQSEPSGTDGSFAIASLAPGEYSLEIDPPTSGKISFGDGEPDARGYLPTWFPGVPRADMAAPVTLAAGENRDVEVRIQKRELRHISGQFQVPEGMERDGISIDVQELTGARMHLASEIAQSAPFHIDGLEQGSYTVRAWTKQASARDRVFVSRNITLEDRDIDDLKLAMRQGVVLGAVLKMAEPNADLPSEFHFDAYSLDGWRGDQWGRTRPDDLHLAGLPPGEYLPQLFIDDPRYALVSTVSVSYAGQTVSNVPIDVEAPESIVTFVLTSRPGRVIGTVRRTDQNAVAGATVVLVPASLPDAIEKFDLTNPRDLATIQQVLAWSPPVLIANSDSTGAFQVNALVPGTYKGIALTGNDGQRARDPIFLREALRSADSVTVEPGQAANLDIHGLR